MGEGQKDQKAIGSMLGSFVALIGNYVFENPVMGILIIALSVYTLVLGIQALRAGQNKVMAWIGIAVSGFLCLIFFAAFIAGMVMAMTPSLVSV